MTTKATLDAPAIPETIGNAEIDPIVRRIMQLQKADADNRIALGAQFSKLRSATLPYKKDSQKGLTYASAVAKTGYSRATAERYREMYEAWNGSGIPVTVFLTLQENGCNLTQNRGGVSVAGIVETIPSLKTLDVADAKAVEAAVEKVNKDFPVLKAAGPTITLAELKRKRDTLQKFGRESAVDVSEEVALQNEAINKLLHAELLRLATALAPFIGKDVVWAERYVGEISDNPVLLAQRHDDAAKFAKSASFLS